MMCGLGCSSDATPSVRGMGGNTIPWGGGSEVLSSMKWSGLTGDAIDSCVGQGKKHELPLTFINSSLAPASRGKNHRDDLLTPA